MAKHRRCGFFSSRHLLGLAALACAPAVLADNTPQSLPFSQDWTNIGLITTNDIWTGVPGIEGFRGDGLTATDGVDPQTVLAADDPGVLDVNANQTNPNTFTTGGVTEFHLTNPGVALAGSGTADAPYLRLYLNTTGQSGISVRYKLRDVDGSTDNAVQPVALHFRVGSSGSFTNVPAAFVADASSGPSQATLETTVCAVLPAAVDNQPFVQLRVLTTNAAGNDEWVVVDDLLVSTGGCPATLSIGDVSVTEGDAGTGTASFTVSLTQPAPVGGVSFDIATQDGSATVADNDYVPRSLSGQTIPAGQQFYTFDVTVNGDTSVEPNETFLVNVTNVVGAPVTDGQGLGTILNDDVTLTPIHAIQGPGAVSPIVGAVVGTRGIVTAVKSNGFFIQAPDDEADADPLTSEGILVFTGTAPPPAAAVGNRVQVTGTVLEFIPSADPLQPPLTELGGTPSVLQIASGQPLPAPTPLNATFPDPSGTFDQLERVEGMRVSVSSLSVTGPTLGNVDEPNAQATSNGVFYGTVTGVARPFREPGVQQPDPLPSGSPCCVPRFDTNPERLRVDSDGQVGAAAIDVGSGAVVTNLVGPLDYSFRTYTLLPDVASPPAVSGGPVATAVAAPTNREFTVASFNLERFFDTVDDPAIGEPVLLPPAFDKRLARTSRAIRDFLRFPDILGVVEVENLSTLQALAARINSDAVGAGQPDPQYVAFLQEGNDVGGIDVGFLVKTAPVSAGVPRVTVHSVVQEGLTTTWVDPADNVTKRLNDRPPLVLDATVNHPNLSSFRLAVIVNHLRSLNGVGSILPDGLVTEGVRVRLKRKLQAEFLANLVQARQTADPNERLVLVGDFNAFEFNDGFVDSLGTLRGVPTPDDQTVVPGDGADLVTPDLSLLLEAPAQRYSFVFDGNAQSLDHVLINARMAAVPVLASRVEHARIDADFAEVARNNAATAERVADHDPLVAYFEIATFPVELQRFTLE